MRTLHVLIAFAVALTLMSAVYYALWQYSMMQTVGQLSETLNKVMPGEIKYGSTSSNFHPFHPKITLNDTSMVIRDPKTGGTLIAHLGDVVLEVTPFGGQSIKAIVPEKISVVTTLKGRSHEYRLSLIEPSLEFKHENDDFDVVISLNGLLIKGRQNGHFSKLVQVGYSYISKDATLGEWSFVFNNLDLTALPTFKKDDIISSLSLTWNPMVTHKLPLGYIFSALGAKDKVIFDTMMMDVLKGMSERSQISVIESRFLQSGIWYSYKGDLAVDKNIFLEGQGVLSTNKFADMLDNIKKITGQFPMALSRMMKRIGAGENKIQAIDIGGRKGVLSLNGAPVGKMPVIPNFLHLHGRGLR